MRGVEVLVRSPVQGARDALGNQTEAWGEPQAVQDVLVLPGMSADSMESNRPDGVTVAYTLSFPRSFTASLRGCQVKVPGDSEWYPISGDPKPIPDGQLRLPPRWNRTAEAVRADG